MGGVARKTFWNKTVVLRHSAKPGGLAAVWRMNLPTLYPVGELLRNTAPHFFPLLPCCSFYSPNNTSKQRGEIVACSREI